VITGPLTVEQAVQIAREENRRLRSARADVAEAQAAVSAMRAETRLRVSATAYGTTGTFDNIIRSAPGVEPPNLMPVPPSSFGDLNLAAMYPLSTGGALASGVARSEALHQAAGASLAAVELTIARQARTDFLAALQADEVVKIYDDWVKAAGENVRVTRERYSVGKVPLFDLLRAQTDLADAIQQLTTARNDREAARVRLLTTLGVDLASPPELVASPDAEAPAPGLGEALAAADVNRPELAEAAARVRAEGQSIRRAEAAFRPQVYAMAMQDVQDGRAIDPRGGYTVGVVASLPVLDGGARRADLAQATAANSRAEALREDLRQQIRSEVAQAWLRVNTAEQNVRTSEAARAQAEENYRIAATRYETGKSIIVELLDALTALTRARTNVTNARYDRAIARVELQRAVGK
jgi:outer membrane protein TolC